jgi:hypothetical protein
MAITFNISYGSGVPTAAQNVVAQVVNYFASQFTDAVTLNFTVNWGTIGGLGSSSYSLFTYTYDQIKSALASDSKSSDDSTTVSSLPSTDPISGTHSWTMVRAEAKALGLITGTAAGSDGSMTFSNSAAFDFDNSNGVTSGQYDFYGVVAHELTELMGREVNAIGNNVATGAGYHPLDLFKYSGTGSHVYVGTTAGYFSVNNGATNLANFNTNPNGDFGDWASGINDSFLAFSNSGVINPVSTFDLRAMDVIGWDRVATPTAGSPTDFNSDGHPDILWQNDNGSASIWTLGGTNFTGGIPLGNDPGPTWHIKDTADFNNDGHPDILWQNNNGAASIWTLGGTNFTAGIPLGNDPGPTWHIKDTADFNSDGHPDILWQNDNGAASIWTLGGTNFTAGIPLGNNPGPTWHIMDTADFNRDGHPDILWQNDSGAASIWTLGGTNLTAGIPLGNDPGPTWHIKKALDFTRDGIPDILWQNDNGSVGIWEMGGTNLVRGVGVGSNPGSTWHIKDAADYNNDGNPDILFQNDNGSASIWTLDNHFNVTAFFPLGNDPGPSWHIIV